MGGGLFLGISMLLEIQVKEKNSCFDTVCARDFNDFLDEAGLREYGLKSWTNQGPADLNLIRKLKALRGKISRWITECRSKENDFEQSCKKDKEDMEWLMERKDLEETELWVWSECCKNLQEIELYRSRDMRQKSRVKWVSLGDENTSFFHSVVNGRKARNSIPGLEIRGEWVSKPTLIKKEVLRFFRCHFKEEIVKVGNKKIWNNITLDSYFVGVMGEGATINFWTDSWLFNEPLRLVYPNLFRLEKHKWVTVSARIQFTNGSKTLQWEWRKSPSTPEEIAELFSLLSAIFEYDWKGGSGSWKWTADSKGCFSVKAATKLMRQNNHQTSSSRMKWKGWVPLKCKIMVWRTLINRMPTKVELGRCGIILPNEYCVCCDTVPETTTHLLSGYIFTAEIWNRLEQWCSLTSILAFDVKDFMEVPSTQTKSKRKRNILRGIVFTALWSTWNERNTRIFKGVRRRPVEVLESIKMTSYFWYRNRDRSSDLDWIAWCKNPLDVM
ncbi:hypothetical protein SSX86_016305 [Deinandra increscens subsp. villosa]|uniref:Reverse transcriptase zinc-binding domain-containing protein n=1 Tax=Deinandra increscens subsp. villosa TaxID=3103831 RepID=A0AAP0D313_9ASTR